MMDLNAPEDVRAAYDWAIGAGLSAARATDFATWWGSCPLPDDGGRADG